MFKYVWIGVGGAGYLWWTIRAIYDLVQRVRKRTFMVKKETVAWIFVTLAMICGLSMWSFVSDAKSLRKYNTDVATDIAVANYDEYHIHPITVAAILNGESRAMTAIGNNGRPYGMVGRRYSDIETATYAFLRLIRYSEWYGDAWEYDDWQDQLYAIQSHGYCQDGSDYLSYLHAIVRTYNLLEYQDKLDRHLKKKKQRQERKAMREIRKARQKCRFRIEYRPYLAPWEIVTDPEYIKGGTVLIGQRFCDVVETKKGIGYTIYIGDKIFYWGIEKYLGWVNEKARG